MDCRRCPYNANQPQSTVSVPSATAAGTAQRSDCGTCLLHSMHAHWPPAWAIPRGRSSLRLGGVMECAKIQLVYPASATCVSLKPEAHCSRTAANATLHCLHQSRACADRSAASTATRTRQRSSVGSVEPKQGPVESGNLEIRSREALEPFRTGVFLKQEWLRPKGPDNTALHRR